MTLLQTLSYTASVFVHWACSFLLKWKRMPISLFMTVVSTKARHSANLQRLAKAELVTIDKEIWRGLYGPDKRNL